MDAQTLFDAGIAALRDDKDKAKARRLLTESLRLDPQNELAWLWLTRAVDDPQKRLHCVERALSINPNNPQALELKKRLTSARPAAKPAADKTKRDLSPMQQLQIKSWLKKGDDLLKAGDMEGAVAQWVYVLEIQPDHEIALRSAIQQLAKLNYFDDVKTLVTQAIDSGTTLPSIYLTAIEIARRENDVPRVDKLRDRLVRLPGADDQLISLVVDDYMRLEETGKAMHVLEQALAAHPTSQKLLIRMGDLKQKAGYQREAMLYYDRAAKQGVSSKEGRAADKALESYAPVVTDHERGSVGLAWREAVGFGALFLLMGWQDCGLNFAQMGLGRWSGVALSLAGGYLLVTATSSPQQQPLARLLGGKVPEAQQTDPSDDSPVVHEPTHLPILPLSLRVVLGVLGGLLLAAALVLVFSSAFRLLNAPLYPPEILPFCAFMSEYWEPQFQQSGSAILPLVGC